MAKSDLARKLERGEMVLCGGAWDSLSAIVHWAKEFEHAGAACIHIDDYGDDKCP